MKETGKVQCGDCNHHYTTFDALKAQHPFDPDDFVYGCPRCKAVDAWISVCDVQGCKVAVSAGFPTDDGYRNTCHKHCAELRKVTP